VALFEWGNACCAFVIDVQDEMAIVDAVCNAASDASDETREAALQ
jgi:hypothetical protein